jgi:hypothetical protein
MAWGPKLPRAAAGPIRYCPAEFGAACLKIRILAIADEPSRVPGQEPIEGLSIDRRGSNGVRYGRRAAFLPPG